MPPKGLSQSAKQTLARDWMRNSLTVHSLKDLEKILPSVASVNGMQLKDFLQSLQDENMIRVEKIGSGNWYWCFGTEEKKQREKMLPSLRDEHTKYSAMVDELKGQAEAAKQDDEDKDEMDALMKTISEKETELTALKKELEGYKDNDPAEFAKRKEEIKTYKVEAERWTDNIHCLEDYFLELTLGDKEGLQRVQEEVYGKEYVEGQGLVEWS